MLRRGCRTVRPMPLFALDGPLPSHCSLDRTWVDGVVDTAVCEVVARFAALEHIPVGMPCTLTGVSELWRTTPIIQICAGRALCRHARIGVQDGGGERVLR